MSRTTVPFTRRRAIADMLWSAALLIVGGLPVRCSRKHQWALLPPRPIPWVMKPFSSARTAEITLPDGRVQLRIRHDLLHGVTPAMLVWWWQNIEGKMELAGKTYPRYLIWHPIDHIFFQVIKRLDDGSVGPGSIFHLVEALHANMRYLIDVALHLRKLDTDGAAVEVRAMGQAVLHIDGIFEARESGTQMTSIMTIGMASWPGRSLNRSLIPRYFPADKRRAWLRHSVEEIGNLEFFLPDLYRKFGARYDSQSESSRGKVSRTAEATLRLAADLGPR
jgi:hypothetical protein